VNPHERPVVVDARPAAAVHPVVEKSACPPGVLPEVDPARSNEAFVRQVQRDELLVQGFVLQEKLPLVQQAAQVV
jgi:hypothetical protein